MREGKRDEEVSRKPKRLRRRARSVSEVSRRDPGTIQSHTKRVAIKKLYGRVCSVDLDEAQRIREEQPTPQPDPTPAVEEEDYFNDENDDPLLDSVPVNMDPEQLGFLVCAQETLRYLSRLGMSMDHPMFSRLRSRFLRGLSEMEMA